MDLRLQHWMDSIERHKQKWVGAAAFTATPTQGKTTPAQEENCAGAVGVNYQT
jgi:hypothetical protein